jgi:selenium metabolism protein YedF
MLLVLKSSMLGDGEPDLGEKLMNAFLAVMSESDRYPAKIICMNSGIFLTTEDSPVADIMAKFDRAGVEILSCGTCLEYFDRKEKLIVGQASNMKETVKAVTTYEKVIYP